MTHMTRPRRHAFAISPILRSRFPAWKESGLRAPSILAKPLV